MIIDSFPERFKGVIEDLIDDMEQHIDELYLTDDQWDDLYENVIDPLNKALTHLDGMVNVDGSEPLEDD